jgi:uncharacterized protein involved in type VI secretion and phage assembly
VSAGLIDLLGREGARFTVAGLLTGTVADNKDPQKLGRVRVNIPALSDQAVTPWARIATPMAGPSRGLYLLPDVGDEVLIGFEGGNPQFPYVLGALWNANNQSPPEDNASGKNDHRSLTSRSGHIVRLDDAEGKERIEVIDKSGKNRLVISTADNSIEISADGDITIASTRGKVTIKGADIEINAQQSLTAKASVSAQLTSDAQTTIKGNPVAIN